MSRRSVYNVSCRSEAFIMCHVEVCFLGVHKILFLWCLNIYNKRSNATATILKSFQKLTPVRALLGVIELATQDNDRLNFQV